MRFLNALKIFKKKKLPKGQIAWGIGLPYTKESFLTCCRKSENSDFIDSLQLQYPTTEDELLWAYYEPIATSISDTIRVMREYGVEVVDIFSADDLKQLFSYSTIIITAHAHRFLECLDFMGNPVEISEIVEAIPEKYAGIVDISACYSSSFLIQCKQRAIFATFFTAETEISVKLRLFLYEQIVRYLVSHPEIDYIDASRVIICRMIRLKSKEDGKNSKVFLGGRKEPNNMAQRSVSAFAPDEIKRGEPMIVQIYIYKDRTRSGVIEAANLSDDGLVEKDRIPIMLDLESGDNIEIQLNVFKSQSLSQVKKLIWYDRLSKVSFFIDVPKDYNNSKLLLSAFIVQNKIVVGELNFSVKVVDEYTRNKSLSDILSRQFCNVFISYSHKDEQRVKFIAQAYKALGVTYFFDRHSLKGGDIYQKKIEDSIKSSDLFILCWSQSASESEYVKKEIEEALMRAFPQITPKDKAPLTIYPILLDENAVLPENMKNIYNFERL